ncbi:MAG: septation protein SpoVG family protein [Lachnospiraceae bacterium]
MNYNMRVYKIEKEDSNLRGFVSITFEDSFCVKNIALKESSKGNLYLEMPKYRDFETEDYVPYFSFKDGEFRKAVTELAADAYHQMTGEEKMIDVEQSWGDEEMYYDLSVSPIRGNDTFKAEAAIKIQDAFAVQQIHVIQGWNGKTFVGMPQRENRQKQEKEDIAHPVSGDFKRELETAVMDEYHKKLENQRQTGRQAQSR